MDKIKVLNHMIEKSQNLVLFTGAGISVASGIPDFRSSKGIYSKNVLNTYSPEVMLSFDYFKNHTNSFYDYYRKNLLYPNASFNKAHAYFARLEEKGKNLTVITQNIDNLHQAAGCKNVLELHGSVYRNYCMKCNDFYSIDHILSTNKVPQCISCGGIVKPDVVLYGEQLDEDVLTKSVKALIEADCLIIVGTSLAVHPAAGLIRYFQGNNIILINKDKTSHDSYIDLVINDDIINVINKLESLDG